MQTLTLQQLRDRVIDATQLDVGGTSRHSTEKVTAYLNEALFAYHTCLVDVSPLHKEKRGSLTTSSSTTVSNGWPANEAVALPADFHQLQSVVLYQSGVKTYLEQAGEAEQHIQEETGEPQRYRVSTDTTGAFVLRPFPPSDGEYTLLITYTYTPTALSNDTDEATFYEGTADYVVYDAVMRLLEDDNVQESSKYQTASRRRDEALARLERYVTRTDRGGPSRVVNTRFFR